MRKIVVHRLGSPARLRLEDCEAPIPKQGEVLINVQAAGVNFADCVTRMGLYRSSWELVGWPLTPGFEVAGTVAAVGDGVSAFAIGERILAVTMFGGYAEAVAVPQ